MLLKGNRKWDRSSQWLFVGKYVILLFLLKGEGKGADIIAGIFGEDVFHNILKIILYCCTDIRADTQKIIAYQTRCEFVRLFLLLQLFNEECI